MIDLTPLDVRKKRGDFGKGLRGYDPQEVDTFLELVAERLEEVVKENMTLRERAERLADQVNQQTGREKAVQDALVTAQQLREEIRSSAERESDLLRREGESEARRILEDAETRARAALAESERIVRERNEALAELERRRARFLTAFRQLLEREMDVVAVEEGRSPLKNVPIDLDLRGGRPAPSPVVDEKPLFDEAASTSEPASPATDADDDVTGTPPSSEPDAELASGGEEAEFEDVPLASSAPEIIDPPVDLDAPTGPSREDLGFFGDDEGLEWEAVPPSDADVHRMAETTEDASEPAPPTASEALEEGDEWLDDILDAEDGRSSRDKGEGEW